MSKKLQIALVLLVISFQLSDGRSLRKRYRPLTEELMKSFPYKLTVKWFSTRIDKFGTVNNENYAMRYLICDQYFKKGNAPIIFYTGCESSILHPAYQDSFVVYQMAEKFGALVVFAEHRYYGKSIPTTGVNKKFLSAEYAMADMADLMVYLKKNIDGAEKSPIITIGGSYCGMMAGWMRMKYPYLVWGAWAASAPVAWFENYTSQFAYDDTVTKDFTDASPICSNLISKAWGQIDSIGATAAGRNSLTKTFKFCDSSLLKTSVSPLTNLLVNVYTDLAEGDYPVPAQFIGNLPAYPVNAVCSFLNDSSLTGMALMENLFKGVNLFYNYTGNVKCISTSTNSSSGDIWDFQACTEMVMPIASNGMFPYAPFSEEANKQQCLAEFGVAPRPQWAIIRFGGRNMNMQSRIIFSNGGLDPWHPGGVLTTTNPEIDIVFIPNGAHHLDLEGYNPKNPPNVNKAVEGEISTVQTWIEEYNTKYL